MSWLSSDGIAERELSRYGLRRHARQEAAAERTMGISETARQEGGEIKYTDPQAKTTYKKQKQLCLKSSSNFHLDFDPFDPYFAEKAYHIKMTLVPPPEKPKPPLAKVDFQDFASDLREAYEEEIGIR